MNSDIKICPLCSEEIKATAIKCRYCGSMLAEPPPGTPLPPGTQPGQTSPAWSRDGAHIPEGTEVREYRIVRLLGEGGMGEVYLAEHTYTGQKVAVKAVNPMLMRDQNVRRRFLEEGRVMAGLDHPNIVSLYAFFEEGGRFFLVMQYVEGETLEALLEREQKAGRVLTVKRVLDLARGILKGMAYAHGHAAPVVHRDIKPANILLDKTGRAVITDFGIAKAMGREKLTRTMGVVGTCEYMSPEQVTGATVSPASDVYSAGIMFYRMLSGQVPFPQTSDTGIEVMDGHRHGQPPALGALRPDCPERVVGWVERALAKAPEERWPDAKAMRAALTGKVPVSAPWSDPALKVVEPHVEPSVDAEGYPSYGGGEILTPSQALPDFEMVVVPAGEFMMGSPTTEKGRNRDERQHPVTLSESFLLGRTPITRTQFRLVMESDPSRFKKGDNLCPVEQVSWFDAVNFCNRLSEMEGLAPCYSVEKSFWGNQRVTWDRSASGYRLPTEAEWEYACRAGTTGARYGALNEIAWHDANSQEHPQPVGRKAPNPWGLYDMLGNVWEWCWDRYGQYPDVESKDPSGPHKSSARVVRGGSWVNSTRVVRASNRNWLAPGNRYHLVGFRCVCPSAQ